MSKTQVGRADLLRLLAVHQTASLDVAARMVGYAPELRQRTAEQIEQTEQKKQPQVERPGRTEMLTDVELAGSREISKELPPERFWYLWKRQKLQHPPSHLLKRRKFQPPPEGDSVVPPELRDIEPLRVEELNLFEFTSCAAKVQSAVSEHHTSSNAHPRLSSRTLEQVISKPDLAALVIAISRHQPLRRLFDNGRSEAAEQERIQKDIEKKLQHRIRRLLGLLSLAVHVEPALLQAVIQLLPSSCSDTVMETAVRTHPDVRWNDMTFAVRPERTAEYQRIFARESPVMQAQLLDVMRRYRSVHAPVIFAVELLRACRFFQPSDNTTQHFDWLEAYLLRFIRTWFERQDDISMIRYARRLLRLLRLLPKEIRNQYIAPSYLYGIAHRKVLRTGAVISKEYEPEPVMRIVQRFVPPVRYLLVQQGERLFFVHNHGAGSVPLQGSLIADLDFSVDCLLLRNEGRVETLPLRVGKSIYSLNSRSDGFCLQTPNEGLYISTCCRPSWAVAIGRNSKGLFTDVPWLGARSRLFWRNQVNDGEGWWAGDGSMRTDQCGLYVDLEIADRATQRFRWMEPGWFMMGSPIDEPERESWGKESQHQVFLTKGFWMADTAVTQKAWEAVMGNNPARFKGDELPVENVSWDDAQRFIRKLNELIPDLSTRLPTEAEWEYSCRAKTTTPFSFGVRIAPEQVNYNGHYPYHFGMTGQNRKETVAVKSLPCNGWGLYEMHGNVWEWCQDYWQDDLRSDEPSIDPQGPETGDVHTVRGGSWFLNGRGVRSAVRGRFVPNFCNSRIGFRLALSAGNTEKSLKHSFGESEVKQRSLTPCFFPGMTAQLKRRL